MAETAPNIVYLGLGSNLGDRRQNLRRALGFLDKTVSIERVSSLYETDPVGVSDQPAFLNLVVEAACALTPWDLLTAVKEIEKRVGRRPTFRWGPRVVDVDILVFGTTVVNQPDLRIPHKELTNRAFVLVPLCEVAPNLIVGDGRTACELLDLLPNGQSGVRRIGVLSFADST